MSNAILDGLSLVDGTGLFILGMTVASLVAAIVANLVVSARYRRIEGELRDGRSHRTVAEPVLVRIVREAKLSRQRSGEPNTQAIIEESFQVELKSLLLSERFIRSATGLVIILGLLGTFYGLTLSVGKLVHLVTSDVSGGSDVAQAVTTGLTRALSGMAVAFSNSLLGIASAVVLTVVNIFSNIGDRRTALMIEIETYLDRTFAEDAPSPGVASKRGREAGSLELATLERVVASFGESIQRLDGAVVRFDASLSAFAGSTREFKEFNMHLKDNVQRMSLSFGDLSDVLKSRSATLKPGDGE